MNKKYRHKAVTKKGEDFYYFTTKDEMEEWINKQTEERGLDCRAGYYIKFRDGLELEFLRKNGTKIKTN